MAGGRIVAIFLVGNGSVVQHRFENDRQLKCRRFCFIGDVGDMVASASAAPTHITGLVPMIRVSDVERSAAFFQLLGFEIGNKVPRTGKPHWAWLYQPRADNWKRGANLMLATGERPPKPDAYEALYYLYAADLIATRQQLMAAGVRVGEISHPEYLPAGEFSTEDPDGHRLMIAQSADDTP